MGGAHASSNDLFTVTYPTDHLGFTYPPFSALLFAPFAHFPLRACEVVFSWVNLAALFALIVVSLRAVCSALDKRTVVWWGLALVLPVLLFDPVRQTFLLGQVNIILALMVVADLTMDLPLPRGILVGLAAAIKVTPIILDPVPLPHPPGPRRLAGHRLVLRRRPAGHRVQRLHLVVLLDPLHPGPAAGGHAVVDRQPGRARRDRAHARPHGDHADHLRDRAERRRPWAS